MPDYTKGQPKSDRDIANHSVASTVRIKSGLPEINEPRCHVCQSKYRHAIERMIALGTNYSSISKQFGGDVDRRSIANHAKEHLNYEQAAIREIIEHESAEIQQNYEEGVKGALMYRSYLSAALKRAWDDLIEGNARIDPAVAIQIIQQLDKFDKDTKSAAVDELRFQFNCFMEAVKRVCPREMWEEIAAETQKLIQRSDGNVESTALPA
jgi:hypothetical protein